MGYYTRYNLSIDEDYSGEILHNLREESEGAKYALEDDGGGSESCKWYGHEEEIKKFSKKYPNSLFTLSGEGEESGDIWIKYFKNGKVQVCKAKIVVEPFDPKKLG